MTKEEMLEEAQMLVKDNHWSKVAYEQGLTHRSHRSDFSIEIIFDILYRNLTDANVPSESITYWYGRIMNPNRPKDDTEPTTTS